MDKPLDTPSDEQREGTLALLELLAMGAREIEQGKFRDADKVLSELD